MAFGSSAGSDDEIMSEINMTPLVDVMLVLLIIFIITVPVIQHSVKIDLPQASSQKQEIKPETIRVTVNAQGDYFWGNSSTALSNDDELNTRLRDLAKQNPNTELHIQGDRAVRYERIAELMSAARLAGVGKIGFITEPKPKTANP